MNAGSLLKEVASQLEAITESPNLEARVLVSHGTGRPASFLLAHPEFEITSEQNAIFEALLQRRLNGEPLPYILGHWEFFGRDFEITPDVLIPRPETELLVERAISWLQAHPNHRSVADVGTGSGCIAVCLAKRIPDLRITATDISSAALEMARRNAIKQDVAMQINFVECDLLPQDGIFDMVVANLPYIPTETMEQLAVYGREPSLALDGGVDGLDIIRRLVALGPRRLAPGGLMLLEIEASEGMAAVTLAYDLFSRADIRLHRDLSGRDRLVEIQRLATP
jgi:release factor glutamine methyltransferase